MTAFNSIQLFSIQFDQFSIQFNLILVTKPQNIDQVTLLRTKWSKIDALLSVHDSSAPKKLA